MTDNYIQLKKDDVLRLKIRDDKGKLTGEMLEFDLEDIELPLRYQELLEKDKKNREWLRNQYLIISKKQDVKGKKLYSKNEEDGLKALKEFFKREEEAYDMFLGKDGVKKLLNGKNFKWTTLHEIDEIIEQQIMPKLDISMDRIEKKIMNTYGLEVEEVLK